MQLKNKIQTNDDEEKMLKTCGKTSPRNSLCMTKQIKGPELQYM